MKNFVQPGDTITIPATATVPSGRGVLVGALFGINSNAVVSGDNMVLKRHGVFDHAKATGAVTVGQKLYWDDTNKVFTTTVGTNTLQGVAVQAAASGDATVRIALNGASF